MVCWVLSCIALSYAWGDKQTTADIAGYFAWCLILAVFYALI